MKSVIFRNLVSTTFLALSIILSLSTISKSQTLDAFNPNANVAVDDVEYLADGKIIICGQFTTIGGASRRAIARLNSDGTLDTTFAVVDTGIFNILDAIIQPDSKILITGSFSTINSIARVRIARLNADGTLDTGFDVGLTPPVGSSRMALLPNGKIFVPANFGSGINRVFLRNSDGSADNSFSTAVVFNSTIGQVIGQPDGKVIVVGGFTTVDGNPRQGIARLNANGTIDTSFTANSNGTVFLSTLAPDGKLYAGGNFTSIGGQTRSLFARLNSDGTADTTFQNPQIVGTGVRPSILLPDGKILIAGSFDTIGGVARKQFARLNNDGTLDTTFRDMQVGVDSFTSPTTISRQADGKIIVGGGFVTADGQTRNRLARITSNDRRTSVDFDGDGKTDISIFRPSVGEWYYLRSGNGAVNGAQFGAASDKPVPADYTGDGKTDIAFFRPSLGQWFILRSEDFSFFAFPFGLATDILTPGDFDGDGKADSAVFRPSNGVWYINRSTGGVTNTQFGTNGDRPVVADYDGDGKSDIAIFRPSVGEWYYLRSSDSQVRGAQFGSLTDKTVQGDYTGDGKADFAFYRPSTGSWFVLRSEDFSFFASPFGVSTDTPTIGDYDGDGKFDQAVFRPSNGVWYVNKSNGSGVTIQQFGVGTDLPVPSYYLP